MTDPVVWLTASVVLFRDRVKLHALHAWSVDRVPRNWHAPRFRNRMHLLGVAAVGDATPWNVRQARIFLVVLDTVMQLGEEISVDIIGVLLDVFEL